MERFNSLSTYYKNKYGTKVAKISLNIGLTCPNRDGKKGYGGCIYCSNLLSGEFAGKKEDSIETQFKEVSSVLDKKWPNLKYIAYLQAGSNTYADINYLKEMYERILKLNIVGFNIATRSDCFNEEIYDFLEDINKRTDLTIELGLQTIKRESMQFINQLETLEEFEDAINNLTRRNIKVVVHIINGLPYETVTDMLNTIHYLNKFKIHGLKIHSLLILKNTPLAKYYEEHKFKILTLDEYADIITKQLEILNPDVVIYRVAADAKIDDLIEPKWTIKKLVVLNEINKRLRKKETYQGAFYKSQE